MTFRFARHTNDLEKIKSFYIHILGLELLGSFENHNGYDGVFIGKLNENWHLEFTKSEETTTFNFGDEDFLVFYPNSIEDYNRMISSLNKNARKSNPTKNPYWKENGKLYSDPDGYGIIISNLKTQA